MRTLPGLWLAPEAWSMWRLRPETGFALLVLGLLVGSPSEAQGAASPRANHDVTPRVSGPASVPAALRPPRGTCSKSARRALDEARRSAHRRVKTREMPETMASIVTHAPSATGEAGPPAVPAPLQAVMASAERALSQDPTCTEARAWLGAARCALGDLEGGRAIYEAIAAREREKGVPWSLRRGYALRVATRGLAACLPRDGTAAVDQIDEMPHGEGLRLSAVGDVHLGRGWRSGRSGVTPPREGRGFFDEVKPLLAPADLVFGNLETALLDEGESQKCARKERPEVCHSFRAPTVLAHRLAEAGFDVLSLANNHAGDFGMRGTESTLAALGEAGMAAVGMGGTMHTAEVQGRRVAVLAFGVNALAYRLTDIAAAAAVVRSAAQAHDIVVVSFHGGAEGPAHARVPRKPERYLGEQRGDVYAFAHAVVDAGADLVIGHGPHVWRGMELYRGRLIAYSLGNFSSWYTFPTRGSAAESGVLEVELAGNGVALTVTLHPTRLARTGRPVLDVERSIIKRVRRLSALDFGDPLVDDEGRWQRTTRIAEGP